MIKLYNFNTFILLYIDDTSIKLLKFADMKDKEGVSMTSLESSGIKQIHRTRTLEEVMT